MKINDILSLSLILCFSSCTSSTPPILNTPLRVTTVAEARSARQAALRGDMSAIDTMIGWAIDHTQLDEWGESETVSFWKGMMVRAANERGLKTYYPPDSGIYRGRIAKERIKP